MLAVLNHIKVSFFETYFF